MNIYYTAKDIEELVNKGIYQLELGPHTSLTDFARETAEQLDVKLIERESASASFPESSPAVSHIPARVSSQAYNKPRGCQQASRTGTAAQIQPATASTSENSGAQADATPVNRLVDMMGKIIKRGV
jgi:hypothetical protein